VGFWWYKPFKKFIMTTLKQLYKIKNLLMDAKTTSIGIENLHLTSKLDTAMIHFTKAYEEEEARLRSEGKDGNDIVLIIRD
tara:strand:+ start:299 stop:541 length:243 start_codon:yes stop_codon:yes gene_type:complete